MTDEIVRCAWASTPLSTAYHDAEWGRASHDDRHLFEMLVLEGAQAGLSWEMILRKRERYQELYRQFDPAIVARFGAREIEAMLGDAGVVRNRAKIESSIGNARAFLDLAAEHGSFASWIWRFVDDTPIVTRHRRSGDVPARTALSERISGELRGRGFGFVGPTILYAFMQSIGMADDHLADCFRSQEGTRALSQ